VLFFYPMKPIPSHSARVLAVLLAVTACAAAPQVRQSVPVSHAHAVQAQLDTGPAHYTPADVHFMSGMIRHHAQAILMAGWAPTHEANASIRALCERIVVGQRDEIALMSHWLAERQLPVPDPAHAMMLGMPHTMLMPGMLTDEQLTQLDSARGATFDRLFLQFMIQHHEGAVTMVNTLFGSPGGGEEENVYRMAANIFADQTTEIERMQRMLAALMFQGSPPQ